MNRIAIQLLTTFASKTGGQFAAESHGHFHRNIQLSDHKKGDKVEFMAVSHSSEDLLKFLNSKELVLGTVLFIESIEPFDGTMSVSYDKRQNEMLSSKVCDKLLVRGAEGNS